MRGRTVTIHAQNAHMANVMNAVVLSRVTAPATAITAGRASVAAAATMNTRWADARGTPPHAAVMNDVGGRGRKRQQGDYPEQHILSFYYERIGERQAAHGPCPAGRGLSGPDKDSESRGDSKIYFQLPGDILSAGKIAGSAYKPPPSPIFRGAPSPPRRPRESGAGGGNQIPCRFFWHISC